jgi:hypothetical protein
MADAKGKSAFRLGGQGGDKKSSSEKVRHKILEKIAVPLVVALAGSVPQATATVWASVNQEEADEASVSETLRLASEDAFVFGQEWAPPSSANTFELQQAHRSSSIKLASTLVDHALFQVNRGRAEPLRLDAGAHRNLVQWVLAGHLSPKEAASILVERESSSSYKSLLEIVENNALPLYAERVVITQQPPASDL